MYAAPKRLSGLKRSIIIYLFRVRFKGWALVFDFRTRLFNRGREAKTRADKPLGASGHGRDLLSLQR